MPTIQNKTIKVSKMEEILETGLEIAPCPGLEVAQPDANKYFIKAEEAKNTSFDQPIQSGGSDASSQGWRKTFWVLLWLLSFV